MIATKNGRKTLPRIPAKKIPAALIYEIMDGKPIYYKGYREVINQKKQIEEVMGASTLQTTIIEYILWVLYRSIDFTKYRVLTNEAGLHLGLNNNLSADIAIYEKNKLPVSKADKHYASIPPKIQIEIDVEADMENFDSRDGYIYSKTQKLLDFGVEKVIWIVSDNRKVLIATPNENWQVVDWHKDINVIEGIGFCVGKYLKDEGSPFA